MKNMKRLLILLIGAVIFGIGNVYAYELSFDTAEKPEENYVKIPVIIKNVPGQIISLPGIGCEVSSEATSCKVGSGHNGNYDAEKKLLTGDFQENAVVLIVTIYNNGTDKLTTAKVKLLYDGKTTDWSKEQIVYGKEPEKKASQNAQLKDVYIANAKPSMTPKFTPEVQEYTVYNLPDTVNAITFGYDCVEGSCNVDFDGPINTEGNKVYLNVGENTVKLKVTAEDGQHTSVYVFKVYKGETDFNSSKLKSLVIGDYELSPKFEADKKEYEVTVPYSLVTLATAISYEAADSNAIVEIKGHDNLVVGENEVTIKVTNADKSEETVYKIKVTRLDDQNVIVKAYKDGKVTFIDSSNEKQELSEEEFEKKYPDEYKKIKDGTYKFDEDGNIVKDDNANSEDSKEEKKKSKTWLIVLLIVLGIVIIGVSGFFIFRKPNDKKKKKDGKDNKEENKDEEKKDETVETTEETKEEANEPEEKDLLNLSDEEVEDVQIRRRSAEDLDYDVEREIESVEHTATHRSLDDTVDIDEALSDLMSTRQYNFKDEDE